LGSTNGTLVNGRRAAANDQIPLTDGDEVQIGQNRFIYRVNTGA